MSVPSLAHSPLRATLAGLAAIAIWSAMAVFASFALAVPPLEQVALAFTVSTALSLIYCLATRVSPRRMFAQPPGAWAVGLGGFFGFHFCYFVAFQHAPAVEASLITYLWPLLIVVLAALTDGARLGKLHLAGLVCGVAGLGVLVSGRGPLSLGGSWLGDGAALVAAISWAMYSVLGRRYRDLTSHAVGGYCAVTGLVAWLGHFALEPTVWPHGQAAIALLAIGLGPAGGAFFAWDVGIKYGDLRLLGILAYLTPLASTGWLVLAGQASASGSLALSCAMIVAGAVLGGLGSRRAQSKASPAT